MYTIRERREQLGMTQAELAEKVEVNQAAVSNWESRKNVPLRKLHGKIAQALNCAVYELDFG